jgi:hypothetical protein
LPFLRLDAMRDSEMGGRLMRLINRRRRTTLLKGASVRPAGGVVRQTASSTVQARCRSQTYGPGSGRASPRASGRRCRSWAPCGAWTARGASADRYLFSDKDSGQPLGPGMLKLARFDQRCIISKLAWKSRDARSNGTATKTTSRPGAEMP